MREIALILRGNIRKSKSAFLGIAFMMLIVSLSLTITLSIVINTDKRDRELMESCGLGNIMAAMNWKVGQEPYEEYETRCEQITDELEKCQDVEKVDRIPTLYLNIADANGKKGNTNNFVFSQDNSYLQYNIYDEQKHLLEDVVLNKGEIIVPISLKSLYGIKVGDKIKLGDYRLDENGERVETDKAYKVIAFMEDPYMGSSLMGVKTMLISDEDFREYINGKSLARGIILSVFQGEDSSMTETEFETLLNKETSYGSQAWITFTYTQMNVYMTLLTNIFSAMLLVFVLMIVIATLIVLSHSISSNIELDFVDLGILKALGVTNKKLRISILAGYLLSAFVGAASGIPLATLLIGVIHDLITPTIGLYGENTPCIMQSAGILFVILLLFALFILAKLSKLKKISPMKAINSGRADVHFSSLLKLPVGKKAFKMSLAYRQFSSEKKQYSAAILITAILVWVLVMVTDMCAWFGDDGEQLDKSFSTVEYDMQTYSLDLATEEELRDIIYKHDPEAERFISTNRYLLLEDSQVACMVCNEPERFFVYEGRSCLYENEIVVTEFIVKKYGIDIGDTVTIKVDDTEKEFIITGYFTCANDAGKCIGMDYDVYDRMRKKVEISEEEQAKLTRSYLYKLSNPELVQEICEDVSARFDEETATVSESGSGFSGMDSLVAAVWGLSILVYIISGVFVAVTVIMICSKIFAKEKQDFGIYKAMGFTSRNLRNMFSIRFAIVALIGSLIGIALAFLLSGTVIGLIFESFGLYNFESSMSLLSLVIPVVFATIVYYIVAYITSKKMKKLSPNVLICE